MELLRYRQCIDGDSKPDLHAVIKRGDCKGCERIPEDHRRRESGKINIRQIRKKIIQAKSLLFKVKIDYDKIKDLIKESNWRM